MPKNDRGTRERADEIDRHTGRAELVFVPVRNARARAARSTPPRKSGARRTTTRAPTPVGRVGTPREDGASRVRASRPTPPRSPRPPPPRLASPPPPPRISPERAQSPSLLPSPSRRLHDCSPIPRLTGGSARTSPWCARTALGPNPYIRMQKQDYAAECAISGRPFTVFRWRPGNDARYKKTVVCREIALAKNVCQVCLLDLDYGIPVQARDAALGRANEMQAKSDVNVEYQTEQIARRLENGEDVAALAGVGGAGGKPAPTRSSAKWRAKNPTTTRTRPPYAPSGCVTACTRADCPYRPCNGDTHMPEPRRRPEICVAEHQGRGTTASTIPSPRRCSNAPSPPRRSNPRRTPPSPRCTWEVSISASRRMICATRFTRTGNSSRCGACTPRIAPFVTYVDRKGAETAAEALHGNLVVNGLAAADVGKPAKPKGDRGAPGGAGASGRGRGRAVRAGAGAGAGAPVGFVPVPMLFQPPTGAGARAAYPSADPSAMGTRRADPSADQAAEGGGR